jgi:hypothetical protein
LRRFFRSSTNRSMPSFFSFNFSRDSRSTV